MPTHLLRAHINISSHIYTCMINISSDTHMHAHRMDLFTCYTYIHTPTLTYIHTGWICTRATLTYTHPHLRTYTQDGSVYAQYGREPTEEELNDDLNRYVHYKSVGICSIRV